MRHPDQNEDDQISMTSLDHQLVSPDCDDEQEDTLSDVFGGLALSDCVLDDLCDGFAEKRREICSVCERPGTVCICSSLPKPPIKLRIEIVVLQHPDEEKRAIRTGRLLQLGLDSSCCKIYRGKKFPGGRKELMERLSSPGTVLLYPGPNSRELSETSLTDPCVDRVVLLDGTWDQAAKMYHRNLVLHKLKQIKLNLKLRSEYAVRTQPNDACLSTLESAVHSAAILEGRPEIVAPLLKPLVTLCSIQLSHGAVNHHSHLAKKELSQQT